VSAALLDDLHAQAGKQLAAAEQAVREDDGPSLARNATGAWANEARVYHAARDMARDVVRAAIFLLLLCVPFAFCMERLLIATPNVYKQIAGAAAIFAVMTLALWSFHPAFKITNSPLIIVLAFAIILMSCLVIAVVYGKFDTELTRLRSGRGIGGGGGAAGGASGGAAAVTTEAGKAAGAGVVMRGVVLGISNMRRRKFRTLLTSVTVILITFTVLCFTSTTRFVGATATPTGVAASHPGLLLRQRGFRPMPEILPDQIRAILADPALKLPQADVVERWWAVSASDPNEQYLLAAAGAAGPARAMTIPAVLGLTPAEARVSNIADALGPAAFARLQKVDVIFLGRSTADQLKVREGDRVRLAGIPLTVAGVYDGAAVDQKVRTLSGEPLMPLKYTAGQVDASGRKLDDSAAESLDAGGGAEAGASYDFLPSGEVAIVPADVCRRLYKSTLRGVAVRFENAEQVKRAADELTRRFALPLFAGGDDGVSLVTASNLASVSGAGAVAIPLVVGALIIFNTMMGSIAERRREIHVYTSLGLAPAHVGVLFVAEALTYGLIGTVFGYIVGQGAGTLLLKLGWLGPVTLNYSGSSAILTMGLILLIVLASSLVPARLAAKIAAPSIDRSWKVPEPRDGVITAELPFTINRTAADGVLAYLAEYFQDHRQGNVGKFAAGRVEPLDAAPTNGDQAARGLQTSIWLTPFDLGVRQRLQLLIHRGAEGDGDIFEVRVILKRLSGDDDNWHRMNRRFLTELRKQFLKWRNLPPAVMLRYVEQSRRLMADRATTVTPSAAPATSAPVTAPAASPVA
jgi:hypothetical protein